MAANDVGRTLSAITDRVALHKPLSRQMIGDSLDSHGSPRDKGVITT